MKLDLICLPLQMAVLAAAGGLLAIAQPAQAAITSTYQFNGEGNWSLDAVGSNGSPVGTLSAFVPLGSTVEQAFLYSSKYSNLSTLPNVTLQGTTYSGSDWTALGVNGFLQAYRTDVTAQMQALIGGGSAAMFNFSVTENVDNGGTDGEVLAIVYSNPAEQYRTIAFLDGFASSAGDTTTVNFAGPVDTTAAGFEALMSLGIGYGYQPSDQSSNVDISIGNRRITSSAGGQDDGQSTDGALITVGGIGDNASNPLNPNAGPNVNHRYDDELYNLAYGAGTDTTNPYLTNGTTSFDLRTANPSGDDIVFFIGINVTAEAGVNEPPSAVPEPASLALWGGVGIVGLVIARRRSGKQAA